MLTVYACQTDIVWEDKPANFARVSALLADTPPEPGGLIVLPEMFATGFSMNAAAIAEDIETGETAAFLAGLARQYRCHVLGGFVTVGDAGKRPRNEAVLYAPDGTRTGHYAKQYPFTLGGEKANYDAGAEPVVLPIGELRVALFICYDLRFPEAFREALTQDANAFVAIASWPNRRANHWSLLLQARAIENQAYVIGINRVGTDPTPLAYSGGSVIIAPSGEVLAEGGDQETILTATLDSALVTRYREELPFLKDRKDS
jgi:omega-amidase